MAKPQMGPSTLQGSRSAKQSMVVILEALSGSASTTEAAERLGVSLSRYYQLETRALQGMLKALEPRPRGPRKSKDTEIRALKAEKKELQREVRRAASLLRAAQRSVGLKGPAKKKGAKKKRRRKKTRGATVLETIRLHSKSDDREGGSDGPAQPGGSAAPASEQE